MLEFDPNNKKAPQAPVYATYIPSRSPQFKTHSRKNHATSAICYRASAWSDLGSPGIVYEYIGGEWVEIDRYERPTHCAHCGAEFQQRWNSAYRLSKHKATPTYKKPVVCETCYSQHFSYWATGEKFDHNEVGVKNGL